MDTKMNSLSMVERVPLARSLVLLFASSMFVVIEPAPFDVLALMWMLWMLPKVRTPLKTALVPLILLVAIFTLARLVTIPQSIDLNAGLKFFSITLYLTLFGIVLAGFIGRYGTRAMDYMMWGIYLGALITAFFIATTKAGVTGFLTDQITAYSETRIRGFFKDPNVFGPSLILVFLYAWMSLQKGARHAWVHIAMLPVAFTLILLSLSRGAWVTFIGACGVFYILNSLNSGSKAIVRSMLILVIGGVITLPLAWAVMDATGATELIEARLSMQAYDTERFYIHHILMDEIVENPFGFGPGQSNVFIRTFYANAQEANAAHNTYLRIAFENGWFGIFTLMTLLFATAWVGVKESLKKNDVSPYMIMAVAGYAATLVSGFTVDTLHWRHLWFEVAFIWGLYAYNNRPVETEPSNAKA